MCDSDRNTAFQGSQVKRAGKCFLLVVCAWTQQLRTQWHTQHLSRSESVCVLCRVYCIYECVCVCAREIKREKMFIHGNVCSLQPGKHKKKKKERRESQCSAVFSVWHDSLLPSYLISRVKGFNPVTCCQRNKSQRFSSPPLWVCPFSCEPLKNGESEVVTGDAC